MLHVPCVKIADM